MAVAFEQRAGAIGSRIRTLRRARRMTQQKLSQQTGVAEAFLSRVENGRAVPSVRTLQRLADGLGVRLSDLVGMPSAASKFVCPMSQSGRCVAELIYPGRRLRWSPERYTPHQTRLLRLANYLVQFADLESLTALDTVMLAMLELPETLRNRQWLRTLERRPAFHGRRASRGASRKGRPKGST